MSDLPVTITCQTVLVVDKNSLGCNETGRSFLEILVSLAHIIYTHCHFLQIIIRTLEVLQKSLSKLLLVERKLMSSKVD